MSDLSSPYKGLGLNPWQLTRPKRVRHYPKLKKDGGKPDRFGHSFTQYRVALGPIRNGAETCRFCRKPAFAVADKKCAGRR